MNITLMIFDLRDHGHIMLLTLDCGYTMPYDQYFKVVEYVGVYIKPTINMLCVILHYDLDP